MRVLFCGSRNWRDADKIVEELKKLDPATTTIVHGDAYGADRIADYYAKRMGFKTEPHPAEWDKYPGNSAGYERNKEMINSGVDKVIAFWKNKSRGTAITINLAEKAGIKPTIIKG